MTVRTARGDRPGARRVPSLAGQSNPCEQALAEAVEENADFDPIENHRAKQDAADHQTRMVSHESGRQISESRPQDVHMPEIDRQGIQSQARDKTGPGEERHPGDLQKGERAEIVGRAKEYALPRMQPQPGVRIADIQKFGNGQALNDYKNRTRKRRGDD
jgi:hypothetical protein